MADKYPITIFHDEPLSVDTLSRKLGQNDSKTLQELNDIGIKEILGGKAPYHRSCMLAKADFTKILERHGFAPTYKNNPRTMGPEMD